MLSGADYTKMTDVKDMFMGPDVDYDIETSHLVSGKKSKKNSYFCNLT